MFRFSRDKKRFFSKVSFKDFTETTKKLDELVKNIRPSVRIEVRTCEDKETHRYSQVTIWDEEVVRSLKEGRKIYTLEQCTEAVWKRSLYVQVTITDETDPQPLMICLSCDRRIEPKRMMFYGQCTGTEIFTNILDALAKPDDDFSIGDGYPKPSKFNWRFIQSKVGIPNPL